MERSTLILRNSQRDRRLDAAVIRRLVDFVLEDLGKTAELGLHFVSARRMAEVNWQFLQHEGSTDVITFDHGSTKSHLYGELFICIADAVKQSAEFRTSWPEEAARYVIHGILHLAGHDDLVPDLRRVMKRAEGRLVRAASKAGLTRIGHGS